MKKVGFGIIGLGMIAETHFIAIEKNENCEFIAAYSPTKGKAEAFCKKHGKGRAYDDLEAFLKDPEIDAVSIATPSGAHLDPALAAIRQGKHAIIEKPLEITPERVDLIINEARKHNVLVSGIFQSRFYEAPQLIKKALDEGRFGRLAICDAQVKWFRSQEYYDSGSWRGTWKLDGGGVLMNQAIHAIDLLQWFCGEAEEAQAYTATLSHERIEVEDTGAAVVRFRNGAIGVIEGSTSVYPGFLKKIEISGTKGSAILEEESIKVWSFREETEEDEKIRQLFADKTKSAGGANDPKAINTLGHERQFWDFADSIINNRRPAITAEDAGKAVRIISAIYKSAESGRKEKV